MVKAPSHSRQFFLFAALLGLVVAGTSVSQAQSPEPQREQLLNGLKILFVPRPGDPNVLFKLRIHSGSAFDTAGKNGTMSLLAELLFPPADFDYFRDEVNGRLVVETDLDAINIAIQGRASESDRMVDILRGALITTNFSPENVNRVRDARIKALREKTLTPVEFADRAIAERLFGSFPYASPSAGTPESVARIERADLMVARDRFLNPNNATLFIVGGVDQKRAMRALRQLLGGWRKSEQLVPSTFRMAAPPDARTLIINDSGKQTAEVRLATRSLARGDRDCLAASLLASITRDRWQKTLTETKGVPVVRHEAHALPGMFVMGVEVNNDNAAKTIEAGRSVLKSLVDSPVLPGEVEKARNEYLAAESKQPPNDKLSNDWLNVEAYSLPPLNDQMRNLSSLSPADVQRVAIRLFRETSLATVIVGNADNLRAHLAPNSFEIKGEQAKVTEQPPTSNTKTEEPSRRRTFVFTTPKDTHPVLKTPKPD